MKKLRGLGGLGHAEDSTGPLPSCRLIQSSTPAADGWHSAAMFCHALRDAAGVHRIQMAKLRWTSAPSLRRGKFWRRRWPVREPVVFSRPWAAVPQQVRNGTATPYGAARQATLPAAAVAFSFQPCNVFQSGSSSAWSAREVAPSWPPRHTDGLAAQSEPQIETRGLQQVPLDAKQHTARDPLNACPTPCKQPCLLRRVLNHASQGFSTIHLVDKDPAGFKGGHRVIWIERPNDPRRNR